MRPGAFASLRREARQAWNGWRHLLHGEDDAARATFPKGWTAFWRSLALMLAGITLDVLLDTMLSGDTLETDDILAGASLLAGSYGAMLAPALLWWRWQGVPPMLTASNWLSVFLLPLSLGITLLDAILQRNAGLLERATGVVELPTALLAFALVGLGLWLTLRLVAVMLRLGTWRVALVSIPLLAVMLTLIFAQAGVIEPEAGVPPWLMPAFWLALLLAMITGMTLLGWLLAWPLRWLARRNSPSSAGQA